MESTMFLAQIWGPIILAVGLGFFASPQYYTKIYRDLEKEKFSALVFGMFAMAVGIVQVQMHNVWDTVPQMLVSFLGWGVLANGAVFTIAPHIADKAGDWAVDSKMVPTAGVVMLVLGGYLTWFAYFM